MKAYADQPDVRVIYHGGHVRDLGIVHEGELRGWLVYRHVEGQWVTLADLKPQLELFDGLDANRNSERDAIAEWLDDKADELEDKDDENHLVWALLARELAHRVRMNDHRAPERTG